jgi:putative transposase
MPRRLLQFQTGYCYHVYNRGNNRQRIFFERENYIYFLKLLRYKLLTSDIDLLAYCLMPNHYHLLVQCQGGDLSKGMQSVTLAYAKAINERYDRTGSLFEGAFKAIEVYTSEYLYQLVRYIHLNPVKADLVDRPEEWEFSSYSEYADLRTGKLPKMELVRSSFNSATTR